MKKMIAVLLLCGCGRVGVPFIEPAQGSQRSGTIGDESVACWVICEEVRPQLERDFSVLPSGIRCSDFVGATTCASCDALLQEKFGVRLTQCP